MATRSRESKIWIICVTENKKCVTGRLLGYLRRAALSVLAAASALVRKHVHLESLLANVVACYSMEIRMKGGYSGWKKKYHFVVVCPPFPIERSEPSQPLWLGSRQSECCLIESAPF